MAPFMNGDIVDPSQGKTEPAFPITSQGLDKYFTYHSHGEDGLSNSLRAKVDLKAGQLIAYITTHTPQKAPAWSSVQTGPNSHIELNSPMLYINHSCSPNVEFRMVTPDAEGKYPSASAYPIREGEPAPVAGDYGVAGELRVSESRDLKAGEDLSFFYPSTEWDMGKPFKCLCDAPKDVCLGEISGAKAVDREVLKKYQINPHILKML
ncbi:hypothetical protein Q7P36_004834 [Cladosporium allicinum]